MRLENISLFKYRVLVTIVELGGFHSAARHLSMTQPAVSRHVRDLDLACAAPLFKRQGRRSSLTEVGEVVYRFALQVTAGAKEVESVVSELIHGMRGEISLGVTPNWGNFFLPGVLQRFSSTCPKVSLAIDTADSETLYSKTLKGDLDFAICVLHNLPEGLDKEELHHEELVLVSSPANQTSAQISGEQFRRLPFIVPSSKVFHAAVLEELYRWGLPQPKVHMAVSSLDVVKECVARGLGVSLLCRRRVTGDIMAGRLREVSLVGEPALRCRYGLIYRKNQVVPPVVSLLTQAVLGALEEDVSATKTLHVQGADNETVISAGMRVI